MFSILLVTTGFVLILSPTELQQVTDLKREKEALEKKLANFMREKAALEGGGCKPQRGECRLDCGRGNPKREWNE